MTQVPSARTECQPSGKAGKEVSKTRRASKGERAMPKPPFGDPHAVTHQPAYRADAGIPSGLSERSMTSGTSALLPAERGGSKRMASVRCLEEIRNLPRRV